MLRVFTAFSGIGSQEMALRNIGIDFKCVGTSEVDKHAILGYDSIFGNKKEIYNIKPEDALTYMKKINIAYNFSTGKSEMPKNNREIIELYNASKRNKNFGDITRISEGELPDFDLFTYSFPCKNISVAGAQAGLVKGSGTQSSLLWECERIIKAKMPKILLMENVKNLVGTSHISELKEWISVLDGLGYSSKWKVLNACDFGLPQNRERVMMVSFLNRDANNFEFPKPRLSCPSLRDLLEKMYRKVSLCHQKDTPT